MTDEDTYNGWTNRETWAVNIYFGDDIESLTELLDGHHWWQFSSEPDAPDECAVCGAQLGWDDLPLHSPDDTLQEYVEMIFDDLPCDDTLRRMRDDIGSLWRVNWHELADNYLRDIRENQALRDKADE